MIIAVSVWDLRDGSFDTIRAFSPNKYKSFLVQTNTKNLPFKVIVPLYIPSEFKFLQEDSAKITHGNIGIPQVDYMFETADAKKGLALRQMDKTQYQKEILEKQNISDFKTLFETQYNATPIEQNGKTIYIKIPIQKIRGILGDLQYAASAYTTNDDSVIELNYIGDTPFTKDELIKYLPL